MPLPYTYSELSFKRLHPKESKNAKELAHSHSDHRGGWVVNPLPLKKLQSSRSFVRCFLQGHHVLTSPSQGKISQDLLRTARRGWAFNGSGRSTTCTLPSQGGAGRWGVGRWTDPQHRLARLWMCLETCPCGHSRDTLKHAKTYLRDLTCFKKHLHLTSSDLDPFHTFVAVASTYFLSGLIR